MPTKGKRDAGLISPKIDRGKTKQFHETINSLYVARLFL